MVRRVRLSSKIIKITSASDYTRKLPLKTAQNTKSQIQDFVSRHYAGFLAHTKIRGDFGGVIYEIPYTGFCKIGKKITPARVAGAFLVGSDLIELVAVSKGKIFTQAREVF